MFAAKSPVLSFAATSLTGLTTVRACKAEDIVIKDFDSRLDRYTAANFLTFALLQASSLWVGLSNVGFLALFVYVCIFSKTDNTSDGHVGLTLMQVMNMIILVWNMFLRLIQTFSFMANIERIIQFGELEPEDSIQYGDTDWKTSSLWPDKGEIKLDKLYLRYSADSDPVLWDISLTIVPGSKVVF